MNDKKARLLLLIMISVLLGQSLFFDIAEAGVTVPPSAPQPASLYPVPRTINDLVEGARLYEEKQVTISGEVIGDIMKRGDFGWVNISDGSNAIGIWVPIALLSQIQMAGRYQVQGDRIKVTGTFYRSDPLNGGEIYIKAKKLLIEQPGHFEYKPVSIERAISACMLMILAALLGLTWWQRNRSLPG